MDSIDYERLQIKGIGPQGLGRRALQLAMAQSKTEEDALKRQFLREGIVAVATEVGGTSDTDFQTKAARAVIGAALTRGSWKRRRAPSMLLCTRRRRPSAVCS